MLLWRDLGAVPSYDSPPSRPPQTAGPRRRPSTERRAERVTAILARAQAAEASARRCDSEEGSFR